MSEYNLVLVHHGIKGQKWGIRRFQNKDGSLTAEGEKKYVNLQKSGMQKIKDTDDIKISKGSQLYRISDKNDKSNIKYMSYRDNDRDFYRGHWGVSVKELAPKADIYEHTYKAKEDIIMPSAKTRRKILSDMATDPKIIREILTAEGTGISKEKYDSNKDYYNNMWTKQMSKKSESKRAKVVSNDIGGNPNMLKEYGQRCVAKGFNATVDDSGRSAVGEMPVIVFTSKYAVSEQKKEKINDIIDRQAIFRYNKNEIYVKKFRRKTAGI